MNFNEAFDELIDSEGGYSKDPTDAGNWTGGVIGKGELKGTKFGIAANTYGYLDIVNLTLDEAKSIYRSDYWDVWVGMEGLSAEMPASFLFELFDAGVNAGRGNAARFLQRAVNVADDGKIGPVTIESMDKMLLDHGIARVEQWFLAQKLNHYTKLRSWSRFGRGWSKRVVKSLQNY